MHNQLRSGAGCPINGSSVTTDRSLHYQNSEAAIAHLQKFAVTFGEHYATMVTGTVIVPEAADCRAPSSQVIKGRWSEGTCRHFSDSSVSPY